MEEYLVPTGDGEAEFVEKRSRFIGRIWRTETEEEALAKIKAMREQHWDATHNVYAYLIRDGAMRYSDDGEPQGTAGMPVLDVLRKENLFQVTCVVTRYFGGILLGGGGLVRAYGRAASQAVQAAGISCKRVWQKLDIPCPYNLFEPVRSAVLGCEGMVQDTEFGAEVLLHVLLPQAQTESFRKRLTDLSAGRVEPVLLEQVHRAFPIST